MATTELDPTHFSFFFQDEPGNEKVIIKWNAGVHLTIHFGTKSGVLDIHRTREKTGTRPKHQTLLTIPHAAFAEAWGLLMPHMETIIQGFTPTRPKLGRLRHRNMFAQIMEPAAMKKVGALRFRNRGRKIQMAKNYALIDPKEVIKRIDNTLPVGSYLVVQHRKGARRNKGFLYVAGSEDHKTFQYLQMKDLNKLLPLILPAFNVVLRSANAPLARVALKAFTNKDLRTMSLVIAASSGEKIVNSNYLRTAVAHRDEEGAGPDLPTRAERRGLPSN